jgi:histidinol dehydrogenase
MYRYSKPTKTSIDVNQTYQGERIEEKINRIVNNKEPITDGAPIIYTNRKDGVNPAYNIKTDRFEIAVDAMDKIAASHAAKREENIKKFTEKLDKSNEKASKPKDSNNTQSNSSSST